MVAKGLSSHLGRSILTLCVLLMAAFPGEAAIVNSLSGFAETPGWTGGVDGSFGARGGNTEQTSLSSNARLQWRGQRESWRLIGSARRTSNGGNETARSLLGHLRHNHRLSARWHTLAFVQLQENPFQRLESRFLAGAGLRWDVARGEKRRFSLGAAHMAEREKIEKVAANSRERASLFFTLSWELREGVRIAGLAFFQPVWSEPEDWRTLGELDLDVALGGGLSLFSGGELEGDSRPPVGVEKVDWSTRTGLRWAF